MEANKKNSSFTIVAIVLEVVLMIGCVVGGVFLWKSISSREQSNGQHDLLEYEYVDDDEPLTKYKIKLDYESKELYVHEYNGCSAVDCDSEERENTISLTGDEIDKIIFITNKTHYDKGYLSSALSSMVRDAEVVERESGDSWQIFREDDSNGDGVVTYREFGNSFLDSMIEE